MAMEPTAHDAETAPPEPLSTEQFERDDPRALYARLRADQRTAIGQEFARLFRLGSDDEARQRFGGEIKGMLAPEQVAAMHSYARQRHPEVLERVMNHPVTVASLEAPGAKPEAINPEDEQAIGPTAKGSLDAPTRIDSTRLP